MATKKGTSKFVVTYEPSFGAEPQPLFHAESKAECEAWVKEHRPSFPTGRLSIADGKDYPHDMETA